mmetsp:Transcript_64607/g.122560  ORF Transcript_64607/g.122560 Transcript_64607/m.122560 type:complete len:89 (+) Transcript_64607:422-688(+)
MDGRREPERDGVGESRGPDLELPCCLASVRERPNCRLAPESKRLSASAPVAVDARASLARPPPGGPSADALGLVLREDGPPVGASKLA